MTTKQILPLSLGVAMIAIASAQGYAFVSTSNTGALSATSLEIQQGVDQLRQELSVGQAGIRTPLARLDAAITDIDHVLNIGVDDEATYREARQTLVQLRNAVTVQVPIAQSTSDAATPITIGEQIIEAEIPVDDSEELDPVAGLNPVGFDSGFSGGSFTSGGRIGGSGGSGGRGGFLADSDAVRFGSFVAAFAIPLSLSDDRPGSTATVSNRD